MVMCAMWRSKGEEVDKEKGRGIVLNRVVKGGFMRKETFVQRPLGSEGVTQGKMWRRAFQARGQRESLVCMRRC